MALQTLEEKRAFVKQFNVFDDIFFELVAKDKDAIEDILRIIFHEPELKVIHLVPQDSIKNLYGRSVRLDALCMMKDGSCINVEVQKSDDDNHQKRARYNAACITANVTEPGEKFENIKDVYIVYISKFDVFQKGRRLYHVGRAILDFSDVTPVNDGEKIIYVNGSTNVTADAEDEDVAELMDFFKNSNGIHEKFKNLSERVDELKNEESEVLVMCELVERYRAEGKAEGRAEGRAEGEESKANEIASKLIAGGLLSKEQIAAATGLSLDEINKLTQTKL